MLFRESFPEDFLHYIWRTINFNSQDLQTSAGEKVHIIHQGTLNHNQGPDFLQAHIQIGLINWYGHVEIHLNSKDWYKHGHDKDAFYNNTILHVVHTSDHVPIKRADGTIIPELVLAERIPPELLHRYYSVVQSTHEIPCAEFASDIPDIHLYAWLDRLSVSRIQEKAAKLNTRLKSYIQDWEQVLWEELAAMMGGTVNQEAFRQMAQQIPYKLLKAYLKEKHILEAILFGSSGFLQHNPTHKQDDYYSLLKQEWEFVKEKHQLHNCRFILMRFMRMRPPSFPTIRISQLADFLFQIEDIIHLLHNSSIEYLISLPIQASTYWNNHYRFFEQTAKSYRKTLGRKQKEVLISNTLIPLTVLYLQAHGRKDFEEIIENSLYKLRPELNNITRIFEKYGWQNKHALHSQGMIQLKKKYCDARLCLQCAIGNHILSKSYT